GVGIQDVARLQTRHRFGGGEQILHVVDGGGVVDDVARLPLNPLPVKPCHQHHAQQRQSAAFQLHAVCPIPVGLACLRNSTGLKGDNEIRKDDRVSMSGIES